MAKRMQEEKGEERIVAKSKPTLILGTHAATSSSTGGYPGHLVILIGRVQEDSWRENTFKTQRRVRK